jgi:hypothetical protein
MRVAGELFPATRNDLPTFAVCVDSSLATCALTVSLSTTGHDIEIDAVVAI